MRNVKNESILNPDLDPTPGSQPRSPKAGFDSFQDNILLVKPFRVVGSPPNFQDLNNSRDTWITNVSRPFDNFYYDFG